MKAQIRKIVIGTVRRDSERLINELGGEGIVHVARWDAAGMESSAAACAGMESSAGAMVNEIESVCDELGISLEYQPAAGSATGAAPVILERDIESDLKGVRAIRDEMDSIGGLRQRLQAEKDALLARGEASMDIAALLGDPGRLAGMTLCSCVFGTVQGGIDPADRDLDERYYIRQTGRHVLGIALSGEKEGLARLLKKYSFEDKRELLAECAARPHDLDEMKEKAGLMENELRTREEAFSARRDETIGKLAELHGIYTALKLSIGARKGFMRTEDAEFISGWIDLADLDRLVSALERVCGKRFFLHVFSEDEMADIHAAAPVRLRNRWFFRAFEMLVKNAGVPGSLELDPTPIAAVAYLLMFGVMFGDIGQGLVLCLTGIIMKMAAKKKELKPFFHDGGAILIAAGLSAVLFGVLYGSVFSSEHIIPALWFHPMEHIMDIFFATIMMGAAFISMGLVMNMINLFRDGEYFEAIFGIHGVLGFIVYAGSLFLAVRYLKFDIPPAILELALIIGLPVALFLVRNVPGYLFLGWKALFPDGVFVYVVESFVDIMEMFTGFLGNSISFIRAGAFALSHAGLSIAIYTLAAIAGPGITAGSVSIIITGNILIILLEGLVCGIQSMRLEYYEFFSKFFRGNGVEFAPLSFRRKQVIVKGVA